MEPFIKSFKNLQINDVSGGFAEIKFKSQIVDLAFDIMRSEIKRGMLLDGKLPCPVTDVCP